LARKKISAKTSRKDSLDPTKDQFITTTVSAADWAIERRRQIGVILGAALLAAIAGILIHRVLESREAAASASVFEGYEMMMAPLVPAGEEEVPPESEEADVPVFESASARATESLRRFEEAVEDRGGGTLGAVARLGEADALLELGEHDRAIAAYEEVLGSSEGEAGWLRANALEGIGSALEAAGRLDEARARFRELAETGGGRAALVGRYEEARIADAQGDDKTAVELLGEVVGEIAESGTYDRLDYLFVQARERLLILDPEADVPALPGGGMGGLEGLDPEMLRKLLEAQGKSGGAR